MIAALTLVATATATATAAAVATPVTPKTLASVALSPSTSWWEKLTVTIAGSGETQSCVYHSSLAPDAPEACAVEGEEQAAAGGSAAQRTQITFERRFSPNSAPALSAIGAGDTLIGGQVMALAIRTDGRVAGCKVVREAGEVTPDYGCAEARAEKFAASAPSRRAPTRSAYMTVLVYGHDENVA